MNLLAVDTLVPQNRREGLTEWVLLAYFIQDFLQLLQVMHELPNDQENYKERHDAPKPYSGG